MKIAKFTLTALKIYLYNLSLLLSSGVSSENVRIESIVDGNLRCRRKPRKLWSWRDSTQRDDASNRFGILY